jgi:hypothetical protein
MAKFKTGKPKKPKKPKAPRPKANRGTGNAWTKYVGGGGGGYKPSSAPIPD